MPCRNPSTLPILARLALLLLFVSLLGTAGCTQRYAVTLNRGTMLYSKGKPRLDKASNCYVFTDVSGRQCVVPSASIREIAPAFMSSQLPTTTAPVRSAPAR
jgi:hypothetical protein